MRNDDERLEDIRLAAEAAVRFTDARTREDLDTDDILTAALMHQITVIGEAAQSISIARRGAMPRIPWPQIAGMRNVIVHAYWRVDHQELWRTVQQDLPLLLRRLSETGDERES